MLHPGIGPIKRRERSDRRRPCEDLRRHARLQRLLDQARNVCLTLETQLRISAADEVRANATATLGKQQSHRSCTEVVHHCGGIFRRRRVLEQQPGHEQHLGITLHVETSPLAYHRCSSIHTDDEASRNLLSTAIALDDDAGRCPLRHSAYSRAPPHLRAGLGRRCQQNFLHRWMKHAESGQSGLRRRH